MNRNVFCLLPMIDKQSHENRNRVGNTGREGGQEVFHLHVHVFGGGANLPKT